MTAAGINLPEGVDPSFLAALPEDIRREVLQNQLGIRPPSRPPVATSLAASTAPVLGGPGVTEVSPEFLAALPPAIQEEVKPYIYIRQTCFLLNLTRTVAIITRLIRRGVGGRGHHIQANWLES